MVGDTFSGGGPVHRRRPSGLWWRVHRRFRRQTQRGRYGPGLLDLSGGSDSEAGNAIAVDAAGNAYVAGSTMSADFTTAHAVQASFGGTTDGRVARDAFVTELSADGSTFVYSTYLGGSGPDRAAGIAVDAAGNAYRHRSDRLREFPDQTGVATDVSRRRVPRNGPIRLDRSPFCNRPGRCLCDPAECRRNRSTTRPILAAAAVDGGNAIAVSPAGDAVMTGFTSSASISPP